MNKQDLINLKNDNIYRAARLNERINDLIRLKNIVLKTIEKIDADIKEIENKQNI